MKVEYYICDRCNGPVHHVDGEEDVCASCRRGPAKWTAEDEGTERLRRYYEGTQWPAQ